MDGLAIRPSFLPLTTSRSNPSCREVLRQYRDQQVPLSGVTVSSDAYGSLPVFDERGRLVGYDVADPGGGAACFARVGGEVPSLEAL